jgi:hypothetical protein
MRDDKFRDRRIAENEKGKLKSENSFYNLNFKKNLKS